MNGGEVVGSAVGRPRMNSYRADVDEMSGAFLPGPRSAAWRLSFRRDVWMRLCAAHARRVSDAHPGS